MKRAAVVIVLLLVAALVALAVVNFLADNAPIRELARLRACAVLADRVRADAAAIQGKDAKPVKVLECDLGLRREQKSFFGQTYDFVSQRYEGDVVQVYCARSGVILGDYACERQ